MTIPQFLRDMLANDDSPASLRSYAYELLAWFRFLLCTLQVGVHAVSL
ncbi:hypothetical protein ACFVZA_32550 [Streptomyces bottropensis]